MLKIMNYYKEILEGVSKKDIKYSIFESNEGLHDCIELCCSEYENLVEDGIVYQPNFIIMYGYINSAGDLISTKATNYIDSFYTFTDSGYGEGLYVSKNTDDIEKKHLFDLILQILEYNNLL